MKRNYLKSAVWIALAAITVTLWYGVYKILT